MKLGSFFSDAQTVKYGVPQGTVLGPILFIIYLNDLFNLPVMGSIISYADDTVLFFEGETWYEVKHKIEHDLRLLKLWFDSRLLTINWDKTCYVPFSVYQDHMPPFNTLTIKTDINNLTIKGSCTVKYLGIYLDSHLRWDKQISYIQQKLRGLLFRFRRLQNILNEFQLRTIYIALVESQLVYGILGWGGVRKTYLDRLEVLQRRFLKIMFNRGFLYPSDQLYAESSMYDIRMLYARSMLTYCFKKGNCLHELIMPKQPGQILSNI